MKMFFDLLPVIIFFIVYKLSNIYMATASAVVISVIALAYVWVKERKIDKMILISSTLVIVLGSITLLLHDDIFIKWKPTAICWAFALVFIGSQFLGKKPLIQVTLEAVGKRHEQNAFVLPNAVWRRLNLAWGLFYAALGAINVYVIYHFSTNAWVNFKLFGMMGLMLVFVLAQSVYLAKHLKEDSEGS